MKQSLAGDTQVTDTRYLNTLRVVATFGVILIHIFSGINANNASSLTSYESYVCIVLRNLWQWCVPIFVMISGAIFLGLQKDITIEKLLKKYVSRILIALIVFGVPFAFLEIFFNSGYQFGFNQVGLAFFYVFQGKLWDHMWYLYMIMGLYLLLPLFKAFVSCTTRGVIEYLLVVLFVFTSAKPMIEQAFSIEIGFNLPIESVYVFYLFLGYYVSQLEIKLNNFLLLGLTAGYVIYAMLMPLNTNFIIPSNGGGIIFLGYGSPVVAIAAFSIFCLLRQNNIVNSLVNHISPLCFGIYLIHPLFINFIFKFLGLTPENLPLTLVIIGTFTIVTLSSILFTFFAKRIRIVKDYIL